jgi:HK97 gp10 family phage protein
MSSQFKVEIEGFEELERNMQKLLKQVDDSMQEVIIEKAAKQAADQIRSRAPIGPTGNARRSIVHKLMPRSDMYPTIGIVAVDRRIAPHFHFLEFGTSKQSPNPVFRSGWAAVASQVMQQIINDIKNQVTKV